MKISSGFFRLAYRPVILVELLIAMALTMAILTMLMGFYHQIDRLNSQNEKEQQKNFEYLYLSTRLAAILPKAVAESDSAKDFLFFTTSIGTSAAGPFSLIFTFDNGVKLDPVFSSHVIGCLYVNAQKQLCLAIWPSFVRWDTLLTPPIKNEILFNNVEQISFDFYVPPAKNREAILAHTKGNPQIIEPLKGDLQGGWKSEWQQDYRALPAMIRIKLTLTGDEKLTLVYPLPLSPLIILYDGSIHS